MDDLARFGNRSLYRKAMTTTGLQAFTVAYKDTECLISAERDLSKDAYACIRRLRDELDGYIAVHPLFLKSLVPVTPLAGAPRTAVLMCEAAEKAGVGPMAAVAGAFAQSLGEALAPDSSELIVENGGDIYISTQIRRTIAVFAGDSPLSMKLGVRIGPGRAGVCTSSGTVGHSLSLGRADAALVVAQDALLADVVATALGNAVKTPDGIGKALESACAIQGVDGALAIMGKHFGAMGRLELVELYTDGS